MKNKILSLVLSLAMTATVLTGFGSIVYAEETDGEITEITFNYTSAKECYTEFIDNWNATVGKENGVKIVMTDMDSDALRVALENGTAPDITNVPNLESAVENGWVVSLEDYEEFSELVSKNEERNYSTEVAGKLYRIPLEARAYGIAYNKDLFVAAGLVDENGEAKAPETLEELREYAKILTDESKQQYGFIYPVGWGTFYSGCIDTAISGTGHTSWDVQTGSYNFENVRPTVETLLAMDDDGSVYPGADGIDNDTARARFAEGNIGMIFTVSWDVSVYNQHLETKCDWGVFPFPSADGNNYYGMKGVTYGNCINAKSVEEKGIEKIALAYNALYSDELFTLRYEKGEAIPYRADIIEATGAIEADSLVGWSDFGAISAESTVYPKRHPFDITGYDADDVDFVNKVWSRQYTVDEWIAERNEIYAEGVKLYEELNPDLDYSLYAPNPDYDRMIK